MKVIGTSKLLILLSCPFVKVSSFVLGVPSPQRLNVLQVSTTSSYDSSSSWPKSLDAELLTFANIANENERREDFESYVRNRLQEDYQSKPGYRISDLPFVRDVNDSLARLGQSIQDDEAWKEEEYKGLGHMGTKSSGHDQLWAFVDILIQFKVLVKNIEGNTKLANAAEKKKSCGSCKVCRCKNIEGNVKLTSAVEKNKSREASKVCRCKSIEGNAKLANAVEKQKGCGACKVCRCKSKK